MENPWVFLSEGTVLKLRICYSLTVLTVLIPVVHAVEPFRVLNNDIKPDVWLDLAEDMRVCARRYTLNWRLHLGERLEEVYDTFAYADLFALLVDIHRARIEEQDLDVRIVFFWGLVRPGGHQGRIHNEDWADLYLGQEFLRGLLWHSFFLSLLSFTFLINNLISF